MSEIKSNTMDFNPDCPLTWGFVGGFVSSLVAVGELDEYDDLLNGAGAIVTSHKYSQEIKLFRCTKTYEEYISVDFFQKLSEWLETKNISDLFTDWDETEGQRALYAKSFIQLSSLMVPHSRLETIANLTKKAAA